MLDLLDSPPTPVDDSLARLEAAVSPLVGIVRDASPLMPAADEPRLHAFACALASSLGTTGAATAEHAGSAHVCAARARAASIGEAIERYSATFVPAGLALLSAAELGDDVVQPETFALFHDRQFVPGFPFARFTRSTRLSFVEGYSLLDARRVLLPAQLVYLHQPQPEQPLVGYPTSNGLACGPTLAEAVLNGLLELVERDAMMLAWSNRLSLPCLSWQEDDRIRELDRHAFAPTGLDYSVVDTSVFFGIPATIGIVHAPAGERAAFAVGAACAPSIVDAWRTCLAEAFSVHRWLRTVLQADPGLHVDAPSDVMSLEDHMLYFETPERAGEAGFLDTSPVQRETHAIEELSGTPKEQIVDIVRRLDRQGVSAYAVDVTSPDVEELGLKVARVIAPELLALDVLGVAPYRGGERRYRASFEAGLLPGPLTFGELNPLPHPFP